MSEITFTPLQDKHFSLLLRWLELPHVKEWWDQDAKWTMKLIEEKYGNYVKGFKKFVLKDRVIEKPIHAFIACVDEKEIGYIQYFNAYDFSCEQKYKFDKLPKSLASFDIFIGEVNYIGKGIGTKLISKFLLEYVEQYFKNIVVCPDTLNTSAIKAYEKVGFNTIDRVLNSTVMLR
ncbi:GNAT family N-acetyltransferase [Wolbachia endosymbiont of Pentidionis agamae]|uniref:GNAT family N-acetyltransferase n=1 Tax=Wolbachia endosymbiont of Pentidionis agamae TaxID=3110435 RepID=UPI002FD568CC